MTMFMTSNSQLYNCSNWLALTEIMNVMDVVFAGNRSFQSGSYGDDKRQAIYSILKRCAFFKSVNGMLHRSISTYFFIYKAFFLPGFTLPYILINIIGSLWRCLSQSW